MRESYKIFVKTSIRFANPWIRIDSQVTNPDLKRFDSYRWSRILTWKYSFQIVDHESSHFQKIRFADSFRDAIFKRFNESNKSSRILSTIGQTNPSESFGFRFANPLVFKRFVSWIRFVTQFPKDSFRDAIFKRFVPWIRFVRHKISNYSFRFVRICVRIPHP